MCDHAAMKNLPTWQLDGVKGPGLLNVKHVRLKIPHHYSFYADIKSCWLKISNLAHWKQVFQYNEHMYLGSLSVAQQKMKLE